jgi:aspartate/methionine/tyrosine aminotransferase
MKVEEFALERVQSLYENTVEINLSDSGVHPYDLKSLLPRAAIEALLSVELGYGWTNGSIELRTAIAKLYPNRTIDEVIVTNGGAEANFLLVTTLLEPGDHVVMVTPNYMQIAGWARAIGVNVATVPLRASERWRVDLDAVGRALTPRTRLITVCNPNNPTGAVMSGDEMGALVEIARSHDVYLHADEVYKGADLDGEERPSFGDLYAKSFVTNSLSKAMALPGLRIGWLLGPKEHIAQAWLRKDYTSITTGALSEVIATYALAPDLRRRILRRSREHLTRNVAILMDWIARTPGFSCTPPRAGGMAMVRYDLPINSTVLAHRLREQESVMVLPGDVFAMDGFLRLGIGAPQSRVIEALRRIANNISRGVR